MSDAARSWRRTRPFWGGLLTLLAGLELLSIPFATRALPLVIQSGTVGATYLISLLLIILGLLLWLQPGQRVFLGVVAVLVSIASFVYANLGGFLVGMLLGLVGGALAAAWTPVGEGAPAAEPAPGGFPQTGMTFTDRRVVSGEERLDAPPREPSPGDRAGEAPRVLIGRVREAAPQGDRAGGDDPGEGDDPEGGHPAAGDPGPPRPAPASPGALPGSGGGATRPESGRHGRPEPERDDPVSGEPDPGRHGRPDLERREPESGRRGGADLERGEPDPGRHGERRGPVSGEATRAGCGRPGGTGTAGRALAVAVLPAVLLAVANTWGRQAQAGTAAEPRHAGATVLPTALPTVLPSLPSVPGILDGLGDTLAGSPPPALLPGAASPSPSPSGGTSGSGPGGTGSTPMVATEPAAVRAPSLTMTGMKFHGVVEMPTATGSVKMLRFTMDRAVLDQPQQTMGGTTLTGRTFTFEGDVVIYTTRMTGKLLGLPQVFTADNPNVIVRALRLLPSLNVPVTMTDIVSEQPYVSADSLRADDLHLVVGS
ncbi:hypothetical protein GCM10009530_50600 [Microbispora corallina]|uniref:Uncharacterized protein n=1 Tax=Microbispora corallina TaxID=83302 RepID=A0ABQ4G6E6_9ACTN|nr:DUF6114 domain-containing protein [Microbispora corallina]GIH42653.1 hypothetical protein Mco01_56530 [Microbispora corallina]